ncbi:MAG TPA: hypothetical protein VN723_11970 [Rhizomicrobium sp.]|nr:hypothetical protein [Rhizomicrobium sp.]
MKLPVLISGALCFGLAACASPNEGNPNGALYAGAAGSVYDSSANPLRTNGAVGYNPMAPMPPDQATMVPSGSTLNVPAPAPSRMPR